MCRAHFDAIIAFGDGKRGNAFIASTKQKIAAEATFWRKYLLRTINIVMTLAMMSLALRGHRKHVDHGDCHGGNFLALVAMQDWSDPVLQDLLQTPARTAKCLNATTQPVNCLSQVSVNGVNEIIQHVISFTLFGAHVIFETPRCDYSVTGQTWAPHEILSMGPRV